LDKRLHRSAKLISRVVRQAHDRADECARRIPWQVLLEARNQYLHWQEFYHWARSIMESEGDIPHWLATKLDEMCPGFIAAERGRGKRLSKEQWLAPVRLGEWIEEHIFGFALNGGWLPAITFYAVRDARYQKASACWSESVEKWRKMKPAVYPSLEAWLVQAAQCDETADLLPEICKQQECLRRVDAQTLATAVSLYIDLEAFASWARAALERSAPPVIEVSRELDARFAGFSELNASRQFVGETIPHAWDRLIVWMGEHIFADSKAAGWYPAILMSAGMHPRAIRTKEYADHCDEIWRGHLPQPYPSFESWRREADCYVDVSPAP